MPRSASPRLAPALAPALAIGSIALAACPSRGAELQLGDETDPVIVTMGDCDGAPDDALIVASAAIQRGKAFSVRAEVSYGGGCEDHFFAACWDGRIFETDPAHFNLVLRHDANDDLCDAFVTRDLVIDLSELPFPSGAAVANPAGVIRVTTP